MVGPNNSFQDALRGVADRLVARYGAQDQDRADMIWESVTAEAHRYNDAAVQTFVPLLVERAVRDRLDDTPPRDSGRRR